MQGSQNSYLTFGQKVLRAGIFPQSRFQLKHFAPLVLSGLLVSTSGYAETNEEGPHFEISRYAIEGNTLVSAEELKQAVTPYVGENRDFSSIQAAVTAIQRLYKSVGYEAVRVVIPRQEIDNAVVRLKVVEAVLGAIEIDGNKYFDEDNIRYSLSSLQTGISPNINALGEDLRLSNESNAKQTKVTFRQSEDPSSVDAQVSVIDDKPWHVATSLDNTGNDSTGEWRWGFAFMHANVLNRDHEVSGQIVTSPGHWEDVKIFALNYRIPLYGIGDQFELSASHSDVNSGVVNTTAGSYGISGSGDNIGGHYIHLLPRFMGWDHRVNAGFDYRGYNNSVTLQGGDGTDLAPDVEVHALSIAYRGVMRQPERQWGLNISLHQNIPAGDNGDKEAYQAVRSGADAAFTVLRYSFNITENLPKGWQLSGELDGQYSEDALISGEQFGLGGINSVRGFQERTLANDRGVRYALELLSPDFGHYLDFAPIKLRATAYFNAAHGWRNHALPGEIKHNHLASIGLGLRASFGPHAHIRLDLSDVLDDGGVGNAGQKFAQASFVLVF